jgi:hypothetical protein
MTQQQILQLARQVLVRQLTRNERAQLQNHAMANGRSIVAASKASTMRLAQWARNQTSAI